MAESQPIDKTSMSLDDIIKMNKKENKKKWSKNLNTFSKNSLNKAKKTIGNKKQKKSLNDKKSVIVSKQNLIKSNVLKNGSNLDTGVNKKVENIVPRLLKRKKININTVADIQITTPNDRFKKPKIERQIFTKTGNKNNDRNDNYKQKTFKTDNDQFRPKALTGNFKPSWKQHEEMFSSRRQGNRSDETARRNSNVTLLSSKEHNKNFENRNVNNRFVNVDYRPPNPQRKSLRSQKMEYEAMARALIQAHRDSKSKGYESRTNGQSYYRR